MCMESNNTKNTAISTGKVYETKTKKISKNVNPFAQYIPAFYKHELKIAKFAMFLWMFFGAILITLLVIASVVTIEKDNKDTYWVLVVFIIPIMIYIPMLITRISRFVSLNAASKTINFKEQKVLDINIIKIYKGLKVSYINANWFSALSYVICLLTFVVLTIISWAVETSNSWNWFDTDWNTNPLRDVLQPCAQHEGIFFAFLTIVIIFFITIFLQVYTIVTAFLRINAIENFYNAYIVTPQEIDQLKKKTNIRDLVIFCVCTIIVGLIVWGLYKAVKNKKNKTTTVAVAAN